MQGLFYPSLSGKLSQGLHLLHKREGSYDCHGGPIYRGTVPWHRIPDQGRFALLCFYSVMEVSQGAQATWVHEAQELMDKHLPFLSEKRSSALSPMGYTAQWCKGQNSETRTIFIGPCLAKKVEAARMESVDEVMTFGELASLFLAKGIDVREMEGSDLGGTTLFEDCREFALSSGVASSVLRRLENPQDVEVLSIDGMDKRMFRTMKMWEKREPGADLIEVMCCEGGCISGPGAVVKLSVAKRLRGGNNASSPVKAMREPIARR